MSTKQEPKRILLISADREFLAETRAAFAASDSIALESAEMNVASVRGEIEQSGCDGLIVDMDAADLGEMEALQRIMRRLEGQIPVLVVTAEFNPAAVRILVQLQVADFLVKPVGTADLVRACVRALSGPGRSEGSEAVIHTFMPAAGGVGNTTLALATAFELQQAAPRGSAICVVDLNLQQGSCAEYLDLEPRFDIGEIENRPDRLDRQLLEVMLSKHSSGLSVLAVPSRPADMRSFDTDVVVRMLDLVSAYFDHVVIDLPRTWFPWSETVLLGTNKLYIVSEMTVPCLRQAQRLMMAIRDTVGAEVRPSVIINRFEKRRQDGGIKPTDVEELLGDRFAGGISNNYRLVRDAVDRGVPLHEIDASANVLQDLRRIVLPGKAQQADGRKSLLAMAGGLFRRAG